MKKKPFFRFSLLITLGLASVGFSSCKGDEPVDQAIAVQSISLNKSTMALAIGSTETLQATINPDNASNKTVTWASSNNTIATVDTEGKVTALADGTVTITAQAGDKTATCAVTISDNVVAVSSVSIDKTTLKLTISESETLLTTILPANATDQTVTWSCNNANATVDATGKVTALANGTAVITAAVGSITATCSITILDGVRINGLIWAKSNISDAHYQWNRNSGWQPSLPTGDTWAKGNDPCPTGWRLPTLNEIISLFNTPVSNEWTTQSGKNGLLFTDNDTGNTIFFPAEGELETTAGMLINEGVGGFYWSSTPMDDGTAYRMYFGPTNSSYGLCDRRLGCSIRCVAE